MRVNSERADPQEESARNVKPPAEGFDMSKLRENPAASLAVETGPDILACARWLQSVHGLFVFAADHPGLLRCAGAHPPGRPCDGKRGKHPCGRWSRQATGDPEVIGAALSRGLRNIGVACKQSGLLVVDEDRPGAFGRFAASIGEAVVATFTVTTAQGRHFYYRPPAGTPLGNGRGALEGWGIDIRGGGGGAGGYVIGPGSVHASGVVYTPVDSAAPIVDAPGWLVEALRQPIVCAVSMPSAGPVRDLSAYLQRALQEERARVREAACGERNTALNKAAYNLGRYVGGGALTDELVFTQLYEAASVHFGAPPEGMAEVQVRATILSGLNGGKRRPKVPAGEQ